ncbi:hypothetical protein FA341_32635 [Pseudomonas aeruginosa]|uniref:Helix-turn-helix domain-containing protein n=1 Tax=Pseudomonas aeruginosa TaxID=287 RepID=A0A6B1YRB2_PSEAI|nr:helix-turn-helix domain-containing protein [Pseudomonas aeruginosa]EIU9544420.1 helix-turn-helix domain-containing protein [Pseudomonas aeruginosa]EIU9551537.1 helix-turn-helix domain-containing protein [Pseudomonas aeruginosa]EJY6032491.1 helix-turn-helix domain-containing protein [Pseudomonas aeruginosa]EKC7897320.1 helix-turn-helix domain-containing protein [Pseudomonas aeruginosa]
MANRAYKYRFYPTSERG